MRATTIRPLLLDGPALTEAERAEAAEHLTPEAWAKFAQRVFAARRGVAPSDWLDMIHHNAPRG